MLPRDPDGRELDAVRSADEPADDDLDVLRRLGEVARSVTAEDAVLDEPPPGLWDRIDAAVADTRPTPSSGPGPADGLSPPRPTAPHAVPPPIEAVPPPGDEAQPPGVTSIAAARRRRWTPRWVLAAAAAAVVVVVGAATLAVTRADDGETVLAAARLEPLADAAPTTAELVEGDDGLQLDLPLAASELPPTEGFYEVWLIDTEIERLISLGPLRGDATYAVPADVDYRDYPIVDVSVEPPDGDPTHSGDSILRGTLS